MKNLNLYLLFVKNRDCELSQTHLFFQIRRRHITRVGLNCTICRGEFKRNIKFYLSILSVINGHYNKCYHAGIFFRY